MKTAKLTQAEVDEYPEGAIWNAFCAFMGEVEKSELAPEQLPAYLFFWYDGEVQNGGHLQYFLNCGIAQAELTPAALRAVGAHQQAELLAEAINLWRSVERQEPQDVAEYVETAGEDEFTTLDNRYYDLAPGMGEILEQRLNERPELFVVVT